MDINISMSKLSKLTKTQLDKMLLDTQAELSRREGVTKAEKEIRAILKKYSINIGDIDLVALRSSADTSRKGKAGAKKKAKGAGGKDNRAINHRVSKSSHLLFWNSVSQHNCYAVM